MLSDAEIREIEESISPDAKVVLRWQKCINHVTTLLATVKEQRELLWKCNGRINHELTCPITSGHVPCRCDQPELQKQIEEKVKP